MSQSSPGWSIYWAINIHLRCPGVVQNHLNNPRVQYVSEIGESDEKSGNSEKTKSVAKNDISIVEELDRTGSNRNTAVSVMLPCTLQFNFIPFLFNDDSIFCHRLLYREPYHAFKKSQKYSNHTIICKYTSLNYFDLFSFDHSKKLESSCLPIFQHPCDDRKRRVGSNNDLIRRRNADSRECNF